MSSSLGETYLVFFFDFDGEARDLIPAHVGHVLVVGEHTLFDLLLELESL